jgi:hypothetical protein
VNYNHLSLTVVAVIVVSSYAFHLRVRRAKHSKDDLREQSSSSRSTQTTTTRRD